MEKLRRKSKYIICSSDFEILAFKLNVNTKKYKNEIVIPTLTEKGVDVSNLNVFYLEIINMLPLTKIKFLTTKETTKKIFICENGKLKKGQTSNIRDYFICNYDFNDEEIERIKQISKQFNLEMIFVPIVDFYKQKSYIDYSVKDIILDLKKQYIKKIER